MSILDTYKPEDKDFEHVLALQQAYILPLTIHERRCNPEKISIKSALRYFMWADGVKISYRRCILMMKS